jgi:cellulose synthase/poly-beta-1,6-N-acetylglucosamine synthase-like glycosyltransferase
MGPLDTTPLAWLAGLTLALGLVSLVQIGLGTRSIGRLRDVAAEAGAGALPRVSVISAARNEERGVRAGLGSLLAQDYPALEAIAIDDRSTDGTGAVLDALAATDPRLRVLHNTVLPAGWLGKNHALHLGAAAATGELLLFTDADVVMAPTTLRRAVTLLRRDGLDHLTVAPELVMPGWLLQSFAAAFMLSFSQYAQPWQARNPKSGKHIGIGAFNLVRADAYHAVGGHAPIAMRPDDDLKLGKLLKQAGYRQDVSFGRGLVSVAWYHTLREVARGLEKNAFAGVEYSVAAVVVATALLLLTGVWPWLALLLTGGTTWLLNLGVVLVWTTLALVNRPVSGLGLRQALGLPLGNLILAWVFVRSTYLALRNDGIDWRGTHYPLAELRRNRV